MHNTYISSTIAFRTEGSPCNSFNDNYYLLNDRVNSRTSSCSLCACCAIPFHGVSINPRFFYGLRQSTLIHYSTTKKLILGGGDRFFRLPICNLDRGCYSKSISLKESCQCSSIRRKRRMGKGGRFGCMVWEEKSGSCDSGSNGTIEAMLSLLTEEVNEEFVGVRERNRGSVVGGVWAEKRGISDYRKREKYVESDYLERNSKSKFESGSKSREEDCRLLGGKEGSFSRDEYRGLRKEGSSCSSYYSVLSSDEIDESDVNVQVRHGRSLGESSSSNKNKESRRGREGVFLEDVRKQSKNNEYDIMGYREVSTQGNAAMRSTGVAVRSDRGLRNEREKVITDISVQQVESKKKSSKNLSNVLDINKSDTEMTSTSQNRFSGRGEIAKSSAQSVNETEEQYCQTDKRVMQQTGSRRKTQQFTEITETQGSDIERASGSQTRFRGREENQNASVNLAEEERESHSKAAHLIIGQKESSRQSQQLSRMSEIPDSDIRRTSTSQRFSESRLGNREESSTSLLSSFQEAKERDTQTEQRVVGKTKSRKESLEVTNLSVISTSATTTVNDSHKHFETRMSSQEENSTSIMELVPERREGKIRQASEKLIKQVGSRKESEKLSEISTFQESSTNRASSSQPLHWSLQSGEQRMGERKENGRTPQVMVTPPPSQTVHRTSQESIRYRKPTSEYAAEDDYQQMLESGYNTLYTQETAPSPPYELDGETRKDKIHGEQSKLMFHEDALGSANRLEESSTHFVKEFVENLSHEVSNSELLDERTPSQTTSTYKDEKYTQQGSSQQVSEEVRSQVHDSTRSSSRSGARGPSDEMWDVAGPSSQEPSRTEVPGEVTSTTGSTIVRSGRSLWSIIGDIVRMRWGARSETHKSTIKAGGKSSSNESNDSEVWFSSHEVDEKDDEKVKKRRRKMPKVHKSADQPYLGKDVTQSLGDTSEGVSSPNKILQIEADAFSSLDTGEGSSASKGTSLVSKEESSSWKEAENRGQGIPSSVSTSPSPLPLPTRYLMRSPAVKEEISESSKDVVSRSGFTQMEKPASESPTQASGTEGKDGELKRRKLQRKNQVQQERFEEWEEAYRLESEQRRMDEAFMREALLEAKKAADTWEVPVGAVLVQHGQIIARGFNLVEELRDSTAHAEMICIREASKQLQTWRLAETTLYVTLEPCPMCAGAILQARIDTVVWGAPNKLLGADGSWVRLFPSGDEGGSSEPGNQPVGPVHPFHPNMTIRRGILATECADAMQQFFQLRRRKKQKKLESPPTSSLPVSTHPSKFLSKMHDIFNIMFCL